MGDTCGCDPFRIRGGQGRPPEQRAVGPKGNISLYGPSLADTPHNNALERTRRVGVPASRAIVGVSPRRSTRCSTYVAGRPIGLRPRAAWRGSLESARNPTCAIPKPVILFATIPSGSWSSGGWAGSSAVAPTSDRHLRLGLRLELGKAAIGLRVAPQRRATQNNALERMRRGGVPAARAVVRVSPHRSTRCSAGSLERASDC